MTEIPEFPDLPEHHYYAIGRVALDASKLEMVVGLLAAQLGADLKGTGFPDVLGRTGAAVRGLKGYLKTNPDPELQGFYDTVIDLLIQRHQLMHGHVLTPANVEGPWLMVDFRDKSERLMPTTEEYTTLLIGLRDAAHVGMDLVHKLIGPADSLRTQDGSDV